MPGCPRRSARAWSSRNEAGDLFNHAAVQLTADMAGDADLILTMTQAHRERVLQLCPEAADKTYTLIGYATGTDHDIEDPFGGDSDVYLKTLDQIELALVVLLIKLYPQHAEEIRRVYEPKG